MTRCLKDRALAPRSFRRPRGDHPHHVSMWNTMIQVDAHSEVTSMDTVGCTSKNRLSPKFSKRSHAACSPAAISTPHDTAVSIHVALINDTLRQKVLPWRTPGRKDIRVDCFQTGEMTTTQVIAWLREAKYASVRDAILANGFMCQYPGSLNRGFPPLRIRGRAHASILISAVKHAFVETSTVDHNSRIREHEGPG